MRYKTKPVEIEAYEWTGDIDVVTWADSVSDGAGTGLRLVDSVLGVKLFVDTLEGTMRAEVGDFIICGLNGEFYPCKPDIFHKKYEAVS